MFHEIPQAILDRMKELEEIDNRDRQDGTPHLKRMRQVPPETGRVLAFLAASAPTDGAWLEIGTSAGYSALWLSLAAHYRNKTLITFELLPEKAALARETFKKAEVDNLVELIHGDARGHIADFAEIAFCFVDCEKEMYPEIFERVAPRMIVDSILIFDNVISHQETLNPFLDDISNNSNYDQVILSVGKGLLVCRKISY
ncbi:MAG: O-methyltransferase [candidate division Zixibacteria bacterium]|nr:O-methyltransferase [Gammaproteobacteria bacterium]NIX59529.1 O-methyltransferase [candidate division Zixibacteria bacterium]